MSRRKRRIVLALGLLLVAGLIAGAPLLVSTPLGRRYVVQWIERRLGRPVTLEGASAWWTSGVTLRGLSVKNPGVLFQAKDLVRAGTVEVRASLPRLLLGGGATDLVVKDATLHLETLAGGRTNLDDLLPRVTAPPPPPPKVPPPPPPPLTISFVNCRVLLRRVKQRIFRRALPSLRSDPPIAPADADNQVLEITSLRLALQQENGDFRASGTGTLRLDGRGGSFRGSFDLGARTGALDLKDFDLGALNAFGLDLAGEASLHAETGAGKEGRPLLKGTFTCPFLKHGDHSLSKVSATFSGSAGRISLSRFSAHAAGGTVKGSGEIDLGGGISFRGEAEASGVDLGGLLARPVRLLVPVLGSGRGLSGTVSGHLDFAGEADRLPESLSGRGVVSLHGARVEASPLLEALTLGTSPAARKSSVDDLRVLFTLAGGRVTPVPYRIATPVGSFSFEGSAGLDGTLDYRVLGPKLPLPFEVTGTLEAPEATVALPAPFR